MAGNPNWVKGVSGNPSGRAKKNEELIAILDELLSDAYQTMRDLVRHADPKIALDATKLILDRRFGKAKQEIDLGGELNVSMGLIILPAEDTTTAPVQPLASKASDS